MGAEGALAAAQERSEQKAAKEAKGEEAVDEILDEPVAAGGERVRAEEGDEQKVAKEAKGEEAELLEGDQEKEQEQEQEKDQEEDQDQEQDQDRELEVTLTPALSQGEREVMVRVGHPEGEVFFSGNAEEVADAEAEEVARGQLARSGLLRGQRVRVGE